ncbi:unnamed protein product [Prunus brigantina]
MEAPEGESNRDKSSSSSPISVVSNFWKGMFQFGDSFSLSFQLKPRVVVLLEEYENVSSIRIHNFFIHVALQFASVQSRLNVIDWIILKSSFDLCFIWIN